MKKYWVEMSGTVVGRFAVEVEAENDEQAVADAMRRFKTVHNLKILSVKRELV